ncbi:hypothetical protein [Alicyclobacillus shizuokensis]|uniref:hypothetical protein n=1 Tax=Alicyclobacillus shizuokensis TaxID=392014 RepID=UPI0008306BB5|nr:hypothetical protein [Alicyclobacillus shizuokensis]MCL6625741.1 hypothetical protein [Alicyclobacillus shizuokensis]
MDWKRLLENKWLLILGIVGAVCLLLGSLWPASIATVATIGKGQTPNTTASNSKTSATAGSGSVEALDHQLAQMLQKIEGIHGVSVMVTFASNGSVEVANNVRRTTTSQGGSKGSQSTTTDTEVFSQRNSDGSESPYVISRQAPAVRGVLVTVNADDFDVAKAEIIDAITNVLDVPAYKISVEPQKPSS